ncbi:transketolase-like TK C-terminal-containing protein [Acidithiobacillus ferrooxidans]|uniref:transketolase-like TK C-terminal-containing protein n=4 Tax=Acidithiobacillaceae TaxID=225058 RepID=UPI00352C5EE2
MGYLLATCRGRFLSSWAKRPRDFPLRHWDASRRSGRKSMPSWEIFRAQPAAYRDTVLPRNIKVRLAVEAAASLGWCEWVGEGATIGLSRFGASAPYPENFRHLGFTVENVVQEAQRLL